jgi:hypothetical protein
MSEYVSTTQHCQEAELILREVGQDFAIAQSDHDLRRLEISLKIAQTHAQIALARNVMVVATKLHEGLG